MIVRIGFLANHSSTGYIVYMPSWFTTKYAIDELKQMMVHDDESDEYRPMTAVEIKNAMDVLNDLMKGESVNRDELNDLETESGDGVVESLLEEFVIDSVEVSDGDGFYSAITHDDVMEIESNRPACPTKASK